MTTDRTIRVSRAALDAALVKAGIGAGQGEALWHNLQVASASQRRFDAVHVLYYLGALIVILGMVVLAASLWDTLSGSAIAITALGYAGIFLGAGQFIWRRFEDLRTPAGLLVVMAVAMTPVVVYGIQKETGLWPFGEAGSYEDFHVWIRSGWFVMEVATIATAALALVFYRVPFLTAPIAFIFWYMSMDLTPILYGSDSFSWEERRIVSLVFGLALLAVAYLVDLRSRTDFAFWLYLAGLLAFWGGLSLMESESELARFSYFMINLALIAVAVFLRRRTFLVFGGVGVFGYIGYLASDLFQDEILFTLALSLAGLLVIALGIWLARNRQAIEAFVEERVPPWLARFRPA